MHNNVGYKKKIVTIKKNGQPVNMLEASNLLQMAWKQLGLFRDDWRIGISRIMYIAQLKHTKNRKSDYFSVRSFSFHSWTQKYFHS